MARVFCIPGAAFLFIAFILNVIVSISLPSLSILDVTRTTFDRSVVAEGFSDVNEIRFGIWTPCFYNERDDHICAALGYAYDVFVTDENNNDQVNIASAWTRGLAVHPVATVASLLATALALSEHVTVVLVATLTAWFAALLTLVALIVDLVLYGWTKHQFKSLDVGANTSTAPGLWLTVIACVLQFIGGFSVCLGRIKDRRAKQRAAGAALVEATHVKETSANTTVGPSHGKEVSAAGTSLVEDKGEKEKEKEIEKAESSAGDDVQAAKSGWAKKLKFGKK